eukprot:Nk52_evm58s151 gene=Nk52_evmTU58s151
MGVVDEASSHQLVGHWNGMAVLASVVNPESGIVEVHLYEPERRFLAPGKEVQVDWTFVSKLQINCNNCGSSRRNVKACKVNIVQTALNARTGLNECIIVISCNADAGAKLKANVSANVNVNVNRGMGGAIQRFDFVFILDFGMGSSQWMGEAMGEKFLLLDGPLLVGTSGKGLVLFDFSRPHLEQDLNALCIDEFNESTLFDILPYCGQYLKINGNFFAFLCFGAKQSCVKDVGCRSLYCALVSPSSGQSVVRIIQCGLSANVLNSMSTMVAITSLDGEPPDTTALKDVVDALLRRCVFVVGFSVGGIIGFSATRIKLWPASGGGVKCIKLTSKTKAKIGNEGDIDLSDVQAAIILDCGEACYLFENSLFKVCETPWSEMFWGEFGNCGEEVGLFLKHIDVSVKNSADPLNYLKTCFLDFSPFNKKICEVDTNLEKRVKGDIVLASNVANVTKQMAAALQERYVEGLQALRHLQRKVSLKQDFLLSSINVANCILGRNQNDCSCKEKSEGLYNLISKGTESKSKESHVPKETRRKSKENCPLKEVECSVSGTIDLVNITISALCDLKDCSFTVKSVLCIIEGVDAKVLCTKSNLPIETIYGKRFIVNAFAYINPKVFSRLSRNQYIDIWLLFDINTSFNAIIDRKNRSCTQNFLVGKLSWRKLSWKFSGHHPPSTLAPVPYEHHIRAVVSNCPVSEIEFSNRLKREWSLSSLGSAKKSFAGNVGNIERLFSERPHFVLSVDISKHTKQSVTLNLYSLNQSFLGDLLLSLQNDILNSSEILNIDLLGLSCQKDSIAATDQNNSWPIVFTVLHRSLQAIDKEINHFKTLQYDILHGLGTGNNAKSNVKKKKNHSANQGSDELLETMNTTENWLERMSKLKEMAERNIEMIESLKQ